MTEHNDLAARIERADGPDRSLDRSIWHLLDDYGRAPCSDPVHAPAYTASIDAAMQLVGRDYHVGALLDAIDRCQEDDWLEALPRYIAAAAIRAQVQP